MIEDDDENTIFEEDQIASTISGYYQNLFQSNGNSNFQVVNDVLQPHISSSMNEVLIKIPDDKEICDAVFSIHANTGPGPNGFSAAFYQSFWEVIGKDVVVEIRAFFKTSSLNRRYNETHVCLIPKGTRPKNVSDYRLIALCSTHYKIIAKVFTRRLQPLLSSLISLTQSAFVPKRAILDNILITHEILRYLKTSEAKKHCAMAVKMDMSKAYDMIE